MDTEVCLYCVYKHKRISAFIIYTTVVKIGSEHLGYRFVQNQYIVLCLEFVIQKKELLVAEKFIRTFVKI